MMMIKVEDDGIETYACETRWIDLSRVFHISLSLSKLNDKGALEEGGLETIVRRQYYRRIDFIDARD